MSDFLIFLGESTPEGVRNTMPDFIRANRSVTSGCHVADNLWAVRGMARGRDLFDDLIAFLGDPSIKVVVSLVGEPWLESNCTSSMKCFRSD